MKLTISLLIVCVGLLIGSLFFMPSGQESQAVFSQQELSTIYTLTGLGESDLTQRDDYAEEFGRALFFEMRLSANGRISCATCHDPNMNWADGQALSQGLSLTRRHTPSLWNITYNRWFFWDGRADSPWSQALLPIESSVEMGGNRSTAVRLIASDDQLRKQYEMAFGQLLDDFDNPGDFPADATPVGTELQQAAWSEMNPENRQRVNQVFTNLGKAIAAFEAVIVSNNAPFDQYVQQLKDGYLEPEPIISPSAINGLRIFIGKGNCVSCHAGPNFTDNEFHNIRLKQDPYQLDPGRYDGIDFVKAYEFNGLSAFSEAPEKAVVKYLNKTPRTWGEFKTPSLRNVSQTAPYMHDGRFASLRDVLNHYSTFEDAAPPDHHAESILQPLNLSDQEVNDLIEFLKSLKDDDIQGIADFPLISQAPMRH